MNPSLAVIVLSVLCLCGCSGESTEQHDRPEHFVPLHWPADLVDAAAKIRQRAAVLSTGTTAPGSDNAAAEQELREIVGWVPEVAADTDLSEQQWLPIHAASESLSARLRRASRPLDTATMQAIADYCELLETQAKLLTDTAADLPEPQHQGDTP